MSTRLNAIRDRVGLASHEAVDPDADPGSRNEEGDAPGTEADTALVEREQSVWTRITPSTRLGWVLAFVATGIVLVAINYAWPLVPPILKSVEFVAAIGVLVWSAVLWLRTRQSMLDYWSQFETVAEKRGEEVVVRTGKVDGAAGDDPLFKELADVGMAGLNPTYRTVDDVFSTRDTLFSKISRRDNDGTWGPAKGKLDHAYQGTGEADYLGNVYVVHDRGTAKTPSASEYDWKTLPPRRPDMGTAQTIAARYEQLIEEVVPSLQDRLDAKDDRLDQLRTENRDEPVYTAEDIAWFLQLLASDNRQSSDLPAEYLTNGAEDVLEDVTTTVEEEMDDAE